MSAARALALLALGAGGVVLLSRQQKGEPVKLSRYFNAAEFGGHADKLAPGLLDRLDAFRAAWGAPVLISSHPEAVARKGGDSLSQHNIDRWGHTRAVDCHPEGMDTAEDRARALALAKKVGFTGVGLYLDTARPMLHLDIRPGSRVATWARIEGEYMGIWEALPA